MKLDLYTVIESNDGQGRKATAPMSSMNFLTQQHSCKLLSFNLYKDINNEIIFGIKFVYHYKIIKKSKGL